VTLVKEGVDRLSKKVLTPQDQFRLQILMDAQISPDGKKAVYAVSSTRLEDEKTETALWLLRLDQPDSKPFRLTAHPTDGSPRWAPDSQRVAFTSRRNKEEKAQLYVINIDGGEAELIKTEKSPASTPLWSPDGKSIAFKAMVERAEGPRYPGEPKKSEENKGKQDDKARKDQPHVITDVDYHSDGRGMTYTEYAQLFVVNLEDGECQQLTEREERIGDFIWNQSGSTLLYLVRDYDPVGIRYTTVIREVTLSNKASSKVLDFDGTLNRIDLAPNGRWLLLSGSDNSCPPGTGNARLWVIDLQSESLPLDFDQAVCLTASINASCTQPHWHPSGQSVYFLKHWHGAAELCQVLFADEEVGQAVRLPITDLGWIAHYDVADNDSLIFIAHDFVHPPQLFLRQKDGPKQLTSLNEEFLAEFELCPAEKFTYKGADDWDIEGWLVRPLNYEPGRRYPTVLSVHGGPTGAYFDSFQFPFQLLAHQGFAVVFTNPRGSVTYGTEFAQGCVNDLGGKDFEDIMAGLDKAIEMGVVDPNRVGITGWSYGGYMTCWAVTQTNRFQAAVAGAVITNWYTLYGCTDVHIYDEGLFGGPAFDAEEMMMQRSPMRHVRNVTTPLLLLHGELDIRCPISQSEQFYRALKRLNREVVFIRYPGQYHGIRKPKFVVDRWERTIAWFKHHLVENN
jgi:dipeptidyl aminopeptidase/acylaminoacyl peptidase